MQTLLFSLVEKYIFKLYLPQNTKISMLVNPKLLIKFKQTGGFEEVSLAAARQSSRQQIES